MEDDLIRVLEKHCCNQGQYIDPCSHTAIIKIVKVLAESMVVMNVDGEDLYRYSAEKISDPEIVARRLINAVAYASQGWKPFNSATIDRSAEGSDKRRAVLAKQINMCLPIQEEERRTVSEQIAEVIDFSWDMALRSC